MMKAIKLILSLAVLIVFSHCKKEDTNPVPQNLVDNSSFEEDGESSFDGWEGFGFSFVEDTPENGGNWALQLEPQWLPGMGYAETSITGLSGTHGFHFQCEAKLISNGVIFGSGNVSLRVKTSNDSTSVITSAAIENPEWETISFEAPDVELQEEDELILHFTAGGTEVATWQVLIDQVILEIIE